MNFYTRFVCVCFLTITACASSLAIKSYTIPNEFLKKISLANNFMLNNNKEVFLRPTNIMGVNWVYINSKQNPAYAYGFTNNVSYVAKWHLGSNKVSVEKTDVDIGIYKNTRHDRKLVTTCDDPIFTCTNDSGEYDYGESTKSDESPVLRQDRWLEANGNFDLCVGEKYQEGHGFDILDGKGCHACPAGTYNDGPTHDNTLLRWYKCKTCPDGTHTSGLTGQAICCPVYYASDGTCTNDLNSATAESRTFVTEKGSTCTAGRFYDVTDDLCQLCPRGKFGSSARQHSLYCEKCPAGTASNDPGKSQCTQCGAGKYSPTDEELTYDQIKLRYHCQSCEEGSFQDEQGKSSCKGCPMGYKSDYGSSSCENLCGKHMINRKQHFTIGYRTVVDIGGFEIRERYRKIPPRIEILNFCFVPKVLGNNFLPYDILATQEQQDKLKGQGRMFFNVNKHKNREGWDTAHIAAMHVTGQMMFTNWKARNTGAILISPEYYQAQENEDYKNMQYPVEVSCKKVGSQYVYAPQNAVQVVHHNALYDILMLGVEKKDEFNSFYPMSYIDHTTLPSFLRGGLNSVCSTRTASIKTANDVKGENVLNIATLKVHDVLTSHTTNTVQAHFGNDVCFPFKFMPDSDDQSFDGNAGDYVTFIQVATAGSTQKCDDLTQETCMLNNAESSTGINSDCFYRETDDKCLCENTNHGCDDSVGSDRYLDMRDMQGIKLYETSEGFHTISSDFVSFLNKYYVAVDTGSLIHNKRCGTRDNEGERLIDLTADEYNWHAYYYSGTNGICDPTAGLRAKLKAFVLQTNRLPLVLSIPIINDKMSGDVVCSTIN